MIRKLLLNSTPCEVSESVTPLQRLLSLEGTRYDECLVEAALGCDLMTNVAPPLSILGKWRELLAVSLVLRNKDVFEMFSYLILKRWRHLRACAPWPEFQLFSVYQATVAALLGRTLGELRIEQLSEGACPLEASGYSGFGEVPHPIYHAELGCLLFLYADVTGSVHHRDVALRLAQWQINTLDSTCTPFSGLLFREGEAAEHFLLFHNYFLFCAAANVAEEMKPIALHIGQKLENLDTPDIPDYIRVLANIFTIDAEPTPDRSCQLPKTIHDKTLAMAGCRLPQVSAVATLFGGGTGMGCVHAKDLQIVSFGPQHLPLSDCRGFGLEGGQRLLAEQVKEINASEHEFVVSGAMRMVSAIHKESMSASPPSGIWIDTRQEFNGRALMIDTTFRRGADCPVLAFSFFVRCRACMIEGGRTMKPRSLDHYQGSASALHMEGSSSSMVIHANQQHDEMHVIPLGGGGNFWGADFLISYILPPNQNQFSWQVKL